MVFISSRSVGASIRQPRSSNRRQQRLIRRLRTSNRRRQRSNPAVVELQSAKAEVRGASIGGGGAWMDGGSAADASTRASEQPCPHRTLLLLPLRVARPPLCSWLGVSAALVGRLLDWIRIFYVSEFCFIYFFCRYSMDTCPPRIRWVSVSDTYPIRDTPPPWRIGVT